MNNSKIFDNIGLYHVNEFWDKDPLVTGCRIYKDQRIHWYRPQDLQGSEDPLVTGRRIYKDQRIHWSLATGSTTIRRSTGHRPKDLQGSEDPLVTGRRINRIKGSTNTNWKIHQDHQFHHSSLAGSTIHPNQDTSESPDSQQDVSPWQRSTLLDHQWRDHCEPHLSHHSPMLLPNTDITILPFYKAEEAFPEEKASFPNVSASFPIVPNTKQSCQSHISTISPISTISTISTISQITEITQITQGLASVLPGSSQVGIIMLSY